MLHQVPMHPKRPELGHKKSMKITVKPAQVVALEEDDEEFPCQYCGQDLNSQRLLDVHEQNCPEQALLFYGHQNFQKTSPADCDNEEDEIEEVAV